MNSDSYPICPAMSSVPNGGKDGNINICEA